MAVHGWRWKGGVENRWLKSVDPFSIGLSLIVVIGFFVCWWLFDLQTAAIPVSMVLAVASTVVLSRLNEGLKRQQKLEFDPVTSEIFRNLKDNVKLSNRLHRVDVDAKDKLGQLLAGKEGHGTQVTLFSTLLGPKTPRLIDGQESNRQQSTCGYHDLFFESGSTLSYLGLQLTRCEYYRNSPKPFKFTTNNVLLSQIFLFQEGTTIRLLDGTPKGQYGATFGRSVPSYEPRGRLQKWRASIARPVRRSVSVDTEYVGSAAQFDAMGADLRGFFENNRPDLIVMTSSRFSILDGPHVGSLQNRDFKENLTLFARRQHIPVMFVIYEDKIDSKPINPSLCLSIFGRDARDEDARRDGFREEELGIANISREIARGAMILVVTCDQGPGSVPDPDPDSGSRTLEGTAGLYHQIARSQDCYVEPGTGIDLLESEDRHVRIFIASQMDTLEHEYRRFAKSVRILQKNGYSSKPVIEALRP